MTEEKELLMWGRHIMMGYANRQDATRKDMTEDGWLKYFQSFSLVANVLKQPFPQIWRPCVN